MTPANHFTWRDCIRDFNEEDITPVVAAGNLGGIGGTLDRYYPQSLGTDSNALVTVGGVNLNGSLWWNTTAQAPGKSGSMTVYALAHNVKTVNSTGNVESLNGTSFAAPTVVSEHSPFKVTRDAFHLELSYASIDRILMTAGLTDGPDWLFSRPLKS